MALGTAIMGGLAGALGDFNTEQREKRKKKREEEASTRQRAIERQESIDFFKQLEESGLGGKIASVTSKGFTLQKRDPFLEAMTRQFTGGGGGTGGGIQVPGMPAISVPGGSQGGGVPGISGGISSGEPSDLALTKLKIGPATFGESPASQSERQVRTQVEKGLAKRRRETQEGFRRSIGLFTQMTAQFKAKIDAQGAGGIIPGLAGRASAGLKLKGSGPIGAFPGQRIETALGLNNIITGQNRVIRGVIDMLLKTLPDDFETLETAAPKIAQSLSNAFRLVVGVNRGILTEDLISGWDSNQPTRKKGQGTQEFIDSINFDGSYTSGEEIQRFLSGISLTEIEEEELQKLIDDVLATPAAELASFGASEKRVSEREEEDPFTAEAKRRGLL